MLKIERYEDIVDLLSGEYNYDLANCDKIKLIKGLIADKATKKKWVRSISDLISEILMEYNVTEEEEQELVAIYMQYNKSNLSKLEKTLRHAVEPDALALDILLYAPRCYKNEFNENLEIDHYQKRYVINKKKSLRLLNYLYGSSTICEVVSEMELYAIFEFVFGKAMDALLLTILTERSSKKQHYSDPQKEVWGMVSLFAINYMNSSMEKDDVREIFLSYATLIWKYKMPQRIESIKGTTNTREYGRLITIIDELCEYDEDLETIL